VLSGLHAEVMQSAPYGTRFVFGEGNLLSPLVIVGEAPGKEEEESGKTFVGKAGKLLDSLLAEVSLDRRDAWVTNVVKWRPTSGPHAALRTRTPSNKEIAMHATWLDHELQIIAPSVILCLGSIAAQTVIARHFELSTEHGRWFSGPYGASALATFHPAYANRWGGRKGLIGRLMNHDLRMVKEAYDRVGGENSRVNAGS